MHSQINYGVSEIFSLSFVFQNSAISPTSSKFDYRSLLKEKEQISEEQIKARADYLKKQRDKLLELKKIEQQKQLQVLNF